MDLTQALRSHKIAIKALNQRLSALRLYLSGGREDSIVRQRMTGVQEARLENRHQQ